MTIQGDPDSVDPLVTAIIRAGRKLSRSMPLSKKLVDNAPPNRRYFNTPKIPDFSRY